MARNAFDCCEKRSNIQGMDKLYAMTAFIRIVESGSLTAAADAMDVSQPSMVRTLAALEREVGVRLINRTTRRMALTDEGRDYYHRAQQIVAAVEDAQLSLSARRTTPKGRLRIASSVSFGRTFVAPVVAEYLAAHPEVDIELLLLDRVVDLVEEGMDLAVRVAKLPDSSMVAHGIGNVHRVVVASPAFVREVGKPKTPGDLRGQRCVSFASVTSPSHWDFADGRKTNRIAVANVLVTNQVDAAVLSCVQGLGFGRFLDYHVHREIAEGKLVRVLEKFEGEAIPASIVYPSARHQSPNVRSFVTFSQERLRQRLAKVAAPNRVSAVRKKA
jgi:DNA-binding transcriptional LysR family regulator